MHCYFLLFTAGYGFAVLISLCIAIATFLLPGFDAKCYFIRFNAGLNSDKTSVIMHCYF
jgi:hypothetical protein